MTPRALARSGSGMVLGKFLPPTRGHRYLVDFARAWCDELTVVVGTLAREPVPGVVRHRWMAEMFPDVRVVHCDDENPQYPHEHPDFWNIWVRSIRRFIPEGPDLVFASEDYGFRLAAELGAEYVPVDHARELVPVSATAVREDPMRCWPYLPECVRPWFVRTVRIVGPESTGKSTLAADLAARYDTVHVHEYARPLIDLVGDVEGDLFPRIVRGQAAAEQALARQANRLLFCDSDAFTTALYHELYMGDRPDWIVDVADARSYDLTLLCDMDTPYVRDGQREHPEKRKWFLEQWVERLEARGEPYAWIRGDWDERFAAACAAVDRLLAASDADLPTPRPSIPLPDVPPSLL